MSKACVKDIYYGIYGVKFDNKNQDDLFLVNKTFYLLQRSMSTSTRFLFKCLNGEVLSNDFMDAISNNPDYEVDFFTDLEFLISSFKEKFFSYTPRILCLGCDRWLKLIIHTVKEYDRFSLIENKILPTEDQIQMMDLIPVKDYKKELIATVNNAFIRKDV